MALQFEPASVDDQLAALVGAHLDIVFDAALVGGVDHRAVMRLGIARYADAKSLNRRDQFLAQRDRGRHPLER